jgi:predicted ATPase/DNA-binding CsgD family transcriptional regulator
MWPPVKIDEGCVTLWSEQLSERELEILTLMNEGLSNRQIAEHLYLAIGTVKSHNHNIYGKLGVANRVQALKRARELNLIEVAQKPTPKEITQELEALPHHNLSPQLTPFVGRESELAAIATYLQQSEVRLLTLLGPGGMGKTRLAVEAARQNLTSFKDGVYFVELAPLSSFDNQLFFSIQRFIQLLQAGASLMTCFRDAAENAPEPTSGVFRQLVADLAAGRDMLDALTRLNQRFATHHFARLIEAITTSLRDGTDLIEQLNAVSDVLQRSTLYAASSDNGLINTEDYAGNMVVSAITLALKQRFKQAERIPREQLLSHLKTRSILLILDNCEHLLRAGGRLNEILREAPNVKILATTRERVNLSIETVMPLGGLSIPDPNQASSVDESDAVKLLVQHARQVRPEFAPSDADVPALVRICQQTQGMPLAIMLAVGWLDMLSLDDIADELSRNLDLLQSEMQDLPERQRSVRAALDYTWNRLSEPERRIFARLSVFRGGFTRFAGAEVGEATLRVLQTFVNQALLTVQDGRYSIHELLRQYGQEKLEHYKLQAEARDAHSSYYLEWLTEMTHDIQGERQMGALTDVAHDFNNIREAWLWASYRQRIDLIDAALDTLYLYFYMTDRSEAAAMLNYTLDQLNDEDIALEGRLLTRMALIRSQFEEDQGFFSMAERGLQIAQQMDDVAEIALAYEALGNCAFMMKQDYAAGQHFYQLSLEEQQRAGHLYYRTRCHHKIGVCLMQSGDLKTAFVHTDQARQLAEDNGNIYSLIAALNNLAYFALYLGDYQRALHDLEAIIVLTKQAGDLLLHTGNQLLSYAEMLYLLGDRENARFYLTESLKFLDDELDPRVHAYGAAMQSVECSLSGDYTQAKKHAQRGANISVMDVSTEYPVLLAMAVACCGTGDTVEAWEHTRGLARATLQIGAISIQTWLLPLLTILFTQEERYEKAVECLALAHTHPKSPPGWLAWSLLTTTQAQLEQTLPSEVYQAAWERGIQLDLSEVVATYFPSA